jgi:hypothetical protein
LETFYEYRARYWDVFSKWTSYPRAYVVNEFKGWFIPPATTRYKFYQYCDDWCKVSFSNVTGDSTENVTDLVSQSGHTAYRNFYDSTRDYDHNQSSEWVSLIEGEPYYIHAMSTEGFDVDRNRDLDMFGVALEIESHAAQNTTGHHHSKKEVQYLGVESK